MAEFNKYSDGSVMFEEGELESIANLLSKVDVIVNEIVDERLEVFKAHNLISAAQKVCKAREIWKERKNEDKEVNVSE